MKAIAASIVVASGAYIMINGAHIVHRDTALVFELIGGALGLFGLGLLGAAFRKEGNG
jgi:hypothetical protein